MTYNIVIAPVVERKLDKFIEYIVYELRSKQAARGLLNDFLKTIDKLNAVGKSIKLCDNPKLKKNGYRRLNLSSHRYFILYRIVRNTIYVDNIFHNLQDFENKIS